LLLLVSCQYDRMICREFSQVWNNIDWCICEIVYRMDESLDLLLEMIFVRSTSYKHNHDRLINTPVLNITSSIIATIQCVLCIIIIIFNKCIEQCVWHYVPDNIGFQIFSVKSDCQTWFDAAPYTRFCTVKRNMLLIESTSHIKFRMTEDVGVYAGLKSRL
jgi:hypothetical protein